jgi:hypothetical protein
MQQHQIVHHRANPQHNFVTALVLKTVPITETRAIPAGGPGTQTGSVTCSIHGYEGDFVEATAFCCTLGHGGQGYGSQGDYGYGGKGDYGYGDSGSHAADPYQTAGDAAAAGEAETQGQKASRRGRVQTGAKALDDAAAVSAEALSTAGADASAASSAGQGFNSTSAGSQRAGASGAMASQGTAQQQQQQGAEASWRPPFADKVRVVHGSSTQAAAATGPVGSTPAVAAAAADLNMGGFALWRTGKPAGAASVRTAAAVGDAGKAAAVLDLEQWLEAEENAVPAVSTHQMQPAPVAAYDSSRAEALKAGLKSVTKQSA